MEWIQAIDITILTGIRNFFDAPWVGKPWLDNLMMYISVLGNNGLVWITLAILFLLAGNRKNQWRTGGLLLLLCLGANALVCNAVLKPLVARMRPYDLLGYEVLVPHLSDFSFPSGHTAASFAAATAIYAMNKKCGIAAYIFAAVMGFSRLYLGVHFPTDVLAGALLGWLVAAITIYVYRRCTLIKKSRIL
ncbi:MAG: phosphatase PAP2 family protein [Anaerotignum sp.]|nr:phosphatase PAP2 family protein [Anaerotignum sp.]